VLALTAQPADARAWGEAAPSAGGSVQLVDLAEDRRDRDRAATLAALRPPRPAPPPAEGETRESYARALAPPPLDPHDAVEALHLFHLLPDDLPLLESLLASGVETAGQALRLHARGRLASFVSEAAAEALASRARVADEVLRTWRRGRARPIGRPELEAAGVSRAWIDRLGELLEELSGDPRALVRVMEERQDERVKGYRASKLDELRDRLAEAEHLDERELSSFEEARDAALRRGAEDVRRGVIGRGVPVALAESLWQAAERGRGPLLQSRHAADSQESEP
jgi:hypothetical protein